MATNPDSSFMNRCIQLALKGRGNIAPNPMVGCVITHNNKIIGEGYHEKYGASHAEVNAITNVTDSNLLPYSTLYVNLEPCNHFGKTPPCTNLIIKKKIPRVVIGMQDPFAMVNGRGIQKLEDAGIEVICNIEVNACRELNKRFITFHQFQRPFIILKWAETADHYTGIQGKKITISNELSQRFSHQWRTEEHAILVGSSTAITDNPQLNSRVWPGRSPLRIILDRSGRLQHLTELSIFDGTQKTIVFSSYSNAKYTNASTKSISKEVDFIEEVMKQLHLSGIQSVIVEGGATIQNEIIKKGVWDEARVFTSDIKLEAGIAAPKLSMETSKQMTIGNNILSIYKNMERR